MLPEFIYNSYSDIAPRAEADWYSDLDRMLNPLSEKLDVQYYYDFVKKYSSRKPVVNLEDINIITYASINDVRALFFRDSFANALIQFFSNNLGEASYTRIMPFPLGRVENGAYDIVVAEIVERNLHWITDGAPDIPAPLRAGPGAAAGEFLRMRDEASILPHGAVMAEFENMKDGEKNNGIAIKGCFDPALLRPGDEMRIFPVLDNDGDIYIYEAFPILEKGISGRAPEAWGDNLSDCGFSLRINDNKLLEKDFIISIMLVSYTEDAEQIPQWAGICAPVILTNAG
jgi:hypothetical protein